MSDKSHVSMEQHQCPVCGALHSTGALFLDRFLRPSLERHTTTGLSLCPEHQAKADEGFIALVEVLPDRKTYTGQYAHIRREAWGNVFNVPLPTTEWCMVEVGTIAALQKFVPPQGETP